MSAEKESDKVFVDGWIISQILGEGAFGEVRLLVHPDSSREVAMKVVNLSQDSTGLAKREVTMLRMLKHENIIGFVGQRTDSGFLYIFLEYAAGGELFDRIEPDVGMSEAQAQHYFRQLINGVEYMHGVGVTHRDLKPENLLLMEDDVLKISDFGLSTVFRHKGVERKLKKRCGTFVYVAPEVLRGEYDAPPADIWSCGVVLVALLTGELPWDSPSPDCDAFVDWKECRSWRQPPWSKIHNVALSLLRCVLHFCPAKRATIDRIKVHQWFTKDFNKKGNNSLCTPLAKRLCFIADKNEITHSSQPESSLASSQTDGSFAVNVLQGTTSSAGGLMRSTTNREHRVPLGSSDANSSSNTSKFSFSQPAVLDNLIIGTQSQHSQQSQQNMLQKLVRRMTRFVVRKPVAAALAELELACCNVLKFTVKNSSAQAPLHLTVSTMDRRRMPLVFKAMAYGMNGNTLLDFRLSKGDGLEFKRAFVRVRDHLAGIIDNEALNAWTTCATLTSK